MQRMKWTLALALALMLCASSAFAGETPAAPKKEAPPETASYTVPNLNEGALFKDLSKALAETPGILSSAADKEKSLFKVTFEPGKTNPQDILKALSSVSKEVKLEGVAPADPKAAKHDCGKCPAAKSCGSKK